jgi:hypothetical protein
MKQRPENTERKARTILLNAVGWKPRKNPAAGKLFFFLDSFYRTYQELAAGWLHPPIQSHYRHSGNRQSCFVMYVRTKVMRRDWFEALRARGSQSFDVMELGSSPSSRFTRVPLTIVSASVSTASISFPHSTTTKLKCISGSPFGVIVAVPVQFLSTV